MTEDEMVEWCHQFNGYEFEQTPGNNGGQGSLVCCSSQCHKELDVTERLSNKDQETKIRKDRVSPKETTFLGFLGRTNFISYNSDSHT